MITINCEKCRKQSEKFATCNKFSDEAGFICSITKKHCLTCIENKWNNVPIADIPEMKQLLKAFFLSRLIAGDCPRYQVPNPVDIKKAMTKLKPLISNDELEEVFESMIYNQSRIKESDGGHPLTTLNTKFNEIAVEFEMQPVLEKLAGKHNGSSK